MTRPSASGLSAFGRLSLLVLAAIMSGCTSMAPKYEQPPLPVASTYPSPTNSKTSDTATPAAALDWQWYFADPQLRALIATALENNRDLRAAMLRVEEARAMYAIQRADQFPTVGVQADGSRGRVPGDLNLTGQPVISSQYQVGAGLATWELDFWGRVRSLKDAALDKYLATDAARQAVTLSLIAQVADSYLSLRALDERLALARRTIATREESLRIFRRRFEVGSTSKLDLTQVETLLQQARALGAELEQARAAQAHALTQLVGTDLDLKPADTPLDDDAVLQGLSAGLPSELLTNRPDIVAAEYQLKAANANIGAARAAFFPQITLTSAFGTASAELDGLFAGGSRAWNFAPSISLPIFDAGRRQANLALAQAQREQALVNYEKTIQTAFREVSDALSARHWLTEQVAILRASVQAQSERARLARLRYDHGASPFLEVLDAQRDLLSAQQQLVQTRRALLSANVSLYAALGGGSQAFEPSEIAQIAP